MTLAERLAAALSVSEGIGPNEDDFQSAEPYADAAVLVAITDRADPGVILTLRQSHLRRHAGQIAFPGGRVDPEDADAIAAALREAEEEIGLHRDRVAVIGTSDRYRTGTGFDILPVIGVIPADTALQPHEAEVAEVFEVPLSFLLASGNHCTAAIDYGGRPRHFYEILWGGRRIWGATAGMIVNLSTRLKAFA